MHPCRKISSEERERTSQFKKELHSFGAVMIKRDYDFSISEKAIRGILIVERIGLSWI